MGQFGSGRARAQRWARKYGALHRYHMPQSGGRSKLTFNHDESALGGRPGELKLCSHQAT
jgi:hypothetical protein